MNRRRRTATAPAAPGSRRVKDVTKLGDARGASGPLNRSRGRLARPAFSESRNTCRFKFPVSPSAAASPSVRPHCLGTHLDAARACAGALTRRPTRSARCVRVCGRARSSMRTHRPVGLQWVRGALPSLACRSGTTALLSLASESPQTYQ